MSDLSTPEIARFLRSYTPFDELDAAAVARVAAAAELESFAVGAVIFSQGDEPVTYLRVVRSGAVEIFKLNVEEFPGEWNVYDSLGEADLKLGDKTNAILNYRKSLELNPQNDNGRDVLRSLGAS